MNTRLPPNASRRAFLHQLAIAGAASISGLAPQSAVAEPPPETTTIRVNDVPALCFAPLLVADAFLRLEGFTDVRYPGFEGQRSESRDLGASTIDVAAGLASDFIIGIDAGKPIVVLSGLHTGCIEVFANDRVRTLRDLAGYRVLIDAHGEHMHVFLSSVAAYIGLDPARDIEWVSEPRYGEWPQMFAAGEVDVVAALPPLSFKIGELGNGHVVLNTTTDDPWRHYFCCMFTASKTFVRQHPVAAKRALRALVKASEFCSNEPKRAAQVMVERGVTSREDYALRTLYEVPYRVWRTHDPKDAMRFYALRLHEAGMVQHTPAEIISRGTDFRFLDQLRRELKV